MLYSKISSYLKPGHNFSKFLDVLSAQRGQFTNLYSNRVFLDPSDCLHSFPLTKTESLLKWQLMVLIIFSLIKVRTYIISVSIPFRSLSGTCLSQRNFSETPLANSCISVPWYSPSPVFYCYTHRETSHSSVPMPSWESHGSSYKLWRLLQSGVTCANKVKGTDSWEFGVTDSSQNSLRQILFSQISKWVKYPNVSNFAEHWLPMNCLWIFTLQLLPALFVKIKQKMIELWPGIY